MNEKQIITGNYKQKILALIDNLIKMTYNENVKNVRRKEIRIINQ